MTLAALVVPLTLAAAPQEIDYRVETDVDRETLGHAVAPIGDADGDGVGDFVATGDGFVPTSVPGAVRAYSGRTGAPLWAHQVPSGGWFGSRAAPLGDLDGDGVADVFVSEEHANRWTGRAWIFSGRSGSTIDVLEGTTTGERFGTYAVDVGDLDQDQVRDFAVAASGVAEIRVYSGSSRQLLRTLCVPASTGEQLGMSMAGGQDFDGDGVPDLVAGDASESLLAPSGGSVRIFSLADGSVLFERHGSRPLGLMGRQVAALGDQDDDGWPDFAYCEYAEHRVEIVSGRTLTTSSTIERLDLHTFTQGVINAGDVDGDGRDDIGVSAPLAVPGNGYQARGTVLVYNAEGDVLVQLEGADNETLGWGVSRMGDIDGDGLAEILVGGPGYAPFGRDVGRVWVVSQDPVAGTNYCSAAANSTGAPATALAVGSSFVGGTGLRLRAEGLPPRTFGVWITARDDDFLPNPGGSFGNLCLAVPIGTYRLAEQIQRSSDTGGTELTIELAQIPLPTGSVAGTPGDTWRFQLWYRDALSGVAGSNFTDGVAVVLR